jgi:hypothetical protein
MSGENGLLKWAKSGPLGTLSAIAPHNGEFVPLRVWGKPGSVFKLPCGVIVAAAALVLGGCLPHPPIEAAKCSRRGAGRYTTELKAWRML